MLIRLFCLASCVLSAAFVEADEIRDMQTQAIETKHCDAVHWGVDSSRYSSWTSHSNRLIPVYAFGTKGAGEGIDLDSYTGENSPYRDPQKVQHLYQSDVQTSLDSEATYMDQTNIFDLELAAVEAGKKHVFLVVFDGMDWPTTRIAAIYNEQKVSYDEGRGTGTHFQEYQAGGTTQYGWMVTSPYRDGAQVDVNSQRVKNPGSGLPGGYNAQIAGRYPWSLATVPEYLIAGPRDALVRHAYTDSATSATSMNCGVKSYNGAIGVTYEGRPQPSVAHLAQAAGYKIGVVTSVPISHATPAATYSHNVSRNDYQDITRDLLGLPSVSHPEQALQGVDVLIGAGFGVDTDSDRGQGENFVVGNKYLTDQDLKAIDMDHGGNYSVALRTEGVAGKDTLTAAVNKAIENKTRLFGFYGVYGFGGSNDGHLPYASADGAYDPAPGVSGGPIEYSEGDVQENPKLAEMTTAALAVLEATDKPFWMMVEAGDVDWANHDNNIDNSIGAVNSGDAAVKVITDWVEKNSSWEESVLIVTADHGHYMMIDHPELLIRPTQPVTESTDESSK
ncbi:alkaline phosphatase [Aeoliella mucimassa]|uniref:Alkaline phosphatase n=1 Tax=Aeoliella mucimassa TaxID=2527972 RepID=A0A518APX8_9BACT|nr:alkaline phosphatase [Aeoliella mucimassa]QDU56772.1 Alkaline phosphatase precursor [Aeoliella mucimassa]